MPCSQDLTQDAALLRLAFAALLVAALNEHTIERNRGLQQPLHAPRHVVLGEVDTACISPCVRFHRRQLHSGEILGPDQKPTQRAQLAGFGRVSTVLPGVAVATRCSRTRCTAMVPTSPERGLTASRIGCARRI